MRLLAIVETRDSEVRRVILHADEKGAHLHLSRHAEDRGCFADEWYENAEQAQLAAREDYGIEASDWKDIGDPEPFCQIDWVVPVRVVGRADGTPQWGRFERKNDSGAWEEFKPEA